MNVIKVDLENPFQADVLADMLTQEGIPHDVVSYHSEAYDGLFQLSQGWGYIEIPEAFEEKAAIVLQRYKAFLAEQSAAETK